MTVAANCLLTSCLLLESSPIDHDYLDAYDSEQYDSDLEYAYVENKCCRLCLCEQYRNSGDRINSLCVCGHSQAWHMRIPHAIAEFVPAQVLIDAYKEAVELDPNKGNPDAIQKNEVYTNPLYIPAEGGSYEFEYLNASFYIWSIYDSSIPPVHSPFSTRLFKTVNSLSYKGPYYSILCDRKKRTWKIKVEPMPMTDEPYSRDIYVLMWTSPNSYKFVFHFVQYND